MENTKTRDLSTLEFLEVLIKEYFVAELRRKIYTKTSDRKYWKKISGFKKQKIIDISNRNRLPHVFEDVEKMNEAYDRFYPLGELPNTLLNKKDLLAYYRVETDVTVTLNDKIVTGKIVASDTKTATVEVYMFDDNSKHKFRFPQVRRIL